MNTVTVVRGDLFRVALQQLGDATQWSRIAAANGLDDPLLDDPAREAVQVLALPDVDATKGGGLAR